MRAHPTLTDQSSSDKQRIVNSKQNPSLNTRHQEEQTPILIFTHLAASHRSRRRISEAAISATYDYGSEIRRGGTRFLTLLERDVRKARKPELQQFIGTTLLLAEDIVLKTCYVDRDAYGCIKKLCKRRPKWDPPRPGATTCALRAA